MLPTPSLGMDRRFITTEPGSSNPPKNIVSSFVASRNARSLPEGRRARGRCLARPFVEILVERRLPAKRPLPDATRNLGKDRCVDSWRLGPSHAEGPPTLPGGHAWSLSAVMAGLPIVESGPLEWNDGSHAVQIGRWPANTTP